MPDDKIVGLSSPSTLKRADSSVLYHASAAQPERFTFGLEFTAMIAIVLILNCLAIACNSFPIRYNGHEEQCLTIIKTTSLALGEEDDREDHL